MDKVKLILVGAGGRGTIYARHLLKYCPDAEISAVAEPRDIFRNRIRDMHHIPEKRCFSDWHDVIACGKIADAVILATQDRMHVEPAVAFARAGYHILQEKPLAPDAEGCLAIYRAVRESGVFLALCHVLRYTPYARALKNFLDSGVPGVITCIEHLEPVGHWLFAHSYVRGNWRKESESSAFLPAKAIHDLDFICYLVNARPARVSAFGSLMFFRRENQPAGAADRCLDCPFRHNSCPYSAADFYIRRIREGKIDNYIESVTPVCTEENMLEVLKTSPYGRCVFACDNDVADHQSLNFEFSNGTTAVFTATGCSCHGGRRTRIFGSQGEIAGDGEKLFFTPYLTGIPEEIPVPSNPSDDRHGGGDVNLLKAFVAAVRTGNEGLILSGAEASLQSHLLVFAAERSRLEKRIVELD